jgi:hypothetical protein
VLEKRQEALSFRPTVTKYRAVIPTVGAQITLRHG